MNPKPSVTQQSSIRQHLGLLRDIADNIRYDRNASPEYRGIERLATILASALTSLDERIGALEHFDANRVYVKRLEAELPAPLHFITLDSLIQTACFSCGSSFEVVEVVGNFFARCVSPKCERHGVLSPITRKLAQAWEDLAQAEDTAYAESEEEARNG